MKYRIAIALALSICCISINIVYLIYKVNEPGDSTGPVVDQVELSVKVYERIQVDYVWYDVYLNASWVTVEVWGSWRSCALNHETPEYIVKLDNIDDLVEYYGGDLTIICRFSCSGFDQSIYEVKIMPYPQKYCLERA